MTQHTASHADPSSLSPSHFLFVALFVLACLPSDKQSHGSQQPHILFPQSAICRRQALPQMDQSNPARSGQESTPLTRTRSGRFALCCETEITIPCFRREGTLARQINLSMDTYWRMEERAQPESRRPIS